MLIRCSECGCEFDTDKNSTCPECGISVKRMNESDEEKTIDGFDTPQKSSYIIPAKQEGGNAYKVDMSIHKNKNRQYTVIIILLSFIALGIAYMSFSQYREKNSSELFDSTQRVLTVRLSFNQDADPSDYTQISRALENGGMILLSLDNLDSTFKSQISSYGACDSNGTYYTLGALLNYISSEGWTLSTCDNTTYYFSR